MLRCPKGCILHMIFPEIPQDGFLTSDPQLRFSETFYLLSRVILWKTVKFTVLIGVLQRNRASTAGDSEEPMV